MAENKKVDVTIVGGGVAGVTVAIRLAQKGVHVTLIEKNENLVSGPPFCHLHAGGNLYREISDEQCLTLLEQSIDFARFYPFAVDPRPTVIAVPKEDAGSPEALLPRLEKLKADYARLVEEDPANAILGHPEAYYALYDEETMRKLKKLEPVEHPKTSDEWMIPVARTLDFSTVKFPLILVQEYGLNLFRLGAGATQILEKLPNVTLMTQSVVTDIKEAENGWKIDVEKEGQHVEIAADYLVNAAGFRTGTIDEMAGVTARRMVEFKAAYVCRWESGMQKWPEIIFHGERGTPRGMGQFTPYPGGHFQLHGMTKKITLFEDGLVASAPGLAQPRLPDRLLAKIEKGWSWQTVQSRTEAAIGHLARFLPPFKEAKTAAIPLYGAQQIPGSDPTLRVAEVDFPKKRYARCEIVKVSSAPDMAEAIVKDMQKEGLIELKEPESGRYEHLQLLEEKKLDEEARKFAQSRGYPSDMGGLIAS
jgi:glycine/D-amino acid oxidase-like deaminating enzyme